MESDLAQEAVNAALIGNWKKAIEVNLQILKISPTDKDAINRLARSYAEIGDIKKAKEFVAKVLKIDPVNQIALKNLEKWKGKIKKEGNHTPHITLSSFVEESGKTKITPLLNICDEPLRMALCPGEPTLIEPHNHRVSFSTTEGKYIGRLSDNLASKMIKLIKEGYEYEAFIKASNKAEISVFIKEVKKGNKAQSFSD